MQKLTALAVALAMGTSTLFTGCESAAGTGALVGAGIGAAIGHNTNNGGGTRTAVGAGLGALAGALAGQAYEEHKREKYGDRRYEDRTYSREGRERYPYGELTRYEGYVRSPYRPYNIIDVRDIPSGALVLDPSVDRPFRNP